MKRFLIYIYMKFFLKNIENKKKIEINFNN